MIGSSGILGAECWLLVNEPRIPPASNRCGHQDDNDNGRRRSRHGAAKTAARFVRGRFGAGPTVSGPRVRQTQIALLRAVGAVSPFAFSLQTRTSANAPAPRSRVR